MLRGIRSRSQSRNNGTANYIVVHAIPNEDIENITPGSQPGANRANSGRTTPEFGIQNLPGHGQATEIPFQFMQGHLT
jgi:hypothetical protein